MNMFKPSRAKNREAYLSMIRDEARKMDIIILDQLIQKFAPELKPHFASNMLGYGQYHYRSASGREGDWPVIALASQKNYLSVYFCACDGNRSIPEKYAKELPQASIGRSCVRLKSLQGVDLKILAKMIRETAALAKKMKYEFTA